MSIQILSDNIVNKIAAGEVIERPASIVKELVENALDAGATKIAIYVKDAGRSILRVTDNGKGISKDDLRLALKRHATSKLNEDNLFSISTLGFRGEALASIVAVSRLRLSSKHHSSKTGWAVEAELGKISDVFPVSQNQGTQVEISDLFFSTPVRLKFMKSDKSEHLAITQTTINLAIANPNIDFTLQINEAKPHNFLSTQDEQSLCNRLKQVISKDFIDNAVPVDVRRDDMHMYGYVSLPSYHSAKPHHQYFYVNKRWVKDKLLIGGVKAGYSDLLPKSKHPIYTLFLDLPPDKVDVNVHPAKYEVRFRNPAAIRSCIVNALQLSFHKSEAKRTSNHLSTNVIGSFQSPSEENSTKISSLPLVSKSKTNIPNYTPPSSIHKYSNKTQAFGHNCQYDAEVSKQISYGVSNSLNDIAVESLVTAPENTQMVAWDDFPLGSACAQIHDNYIISQKSDCMIIIDQHAAHERILYEKLKQDYQKKAIKTQRLLVPEIVNLIEHDKDKLIEHTEILFQCGINIETFGHDAIIVRELPVLFPNKHINILIKDIVAEIHTSDGVVYDSLEEVNETVQAILSRISCHGSVRSGRILQVDEMNALLREMEAIDNTNACNHGRPTFIKLSLKDIEKWFERN